MQFQLQVVQVKSQVVYVEFTGSISDSYYTAIDQSDCSI